MAKKESKMKIFFISDTHFGDERIIRYENRPFEGAAQMGQTIIERWNSRVSDEDIVFHLGDFSSLSREENREILSRLNGKKILVMGNHDSHFSPLQWQEQGFYLAVDYPIIYREFFMLSHQPMYVCANMPYGNIFGHVHANPSYRDYSSQSFCVCCERVDYTPIEFGELWNKMKNYR